MPTVLSGLVLAFALVSAVRAGAQVRKQVFARVAETADLLSAIVASAELAGEATDYEQLQNVLDSIQREDENKVARGEEEHPLFAFLLVEHDGTRVGSLNLENVGDEELLGKIHLRQIDHEKAVRDLADADRNRVPERAKEELWQKRREAFKRLNEARDEAYAKILANPTAQSGLLVIRGKIVDCRPAECPTERPAREALPLAATILVGIRYEPFVREAITNVLLLALAAGLGLVVSAGGAWWLSSGISRPVGRLVQAMERIDMGDLSTRVTVDGKDELALLAHSFNRMATGLQEREQLKLRVVETERSRQKVENLLKGLASVQVAERFLAAGSLDFKGKYEEATILFSDIRGFTTMCERLAPADVFGTLNDYFSRMRRIVDLYGGCILKFMGDALMVSYNVPSKQSHHALRAVYTGIDMQREILRMNREREAMGLEPINVGIGVNTGRLMVGNLGSEPSADSRQGRFEYTVIGDAVNTAQRIESTTPALHLHISESCYEQVKEFVEVVPREPVLFKGKTRVVQTYAVTRRRPDMLVDFSKET